MENRVPENAAEVPAAVPNVPNVNAVEEHHRGEINEVEVANNVAPPSSSGMSLEQIVKDHVASISDNSSDSFPKFYVVVSKDDLPILKQPFPTSEVIRTIKSVRSGYSYTSFSDYLNLFLYFIQGTILFISSRLLGGDGRHWLKAPDGWISEEKANSSNLADGILLVPLAANAPKKETDGKSLQGKTFELPFSSVISDESSPEANVLRKRKSEKKSESTTSTVNDRLEEIRNLQLQLQSMSRVMTDLTQSMVVCQRAITKLVNGKTCCFIITLFSIESKSSLS